MPNLRGWEIFILIGIVVLLFGSKKLPDAARGIGRSLRIFKAETKGLMEDDKSAELPAATAADTALTAPAAATQAVPASPATPAPQVAVETDQQGQTPPGRTTA